MDLNKYAKEIYEQNKAVGWWDDPNRCLFECLQLISTEVAEATEGERKDLMDDHLPHRKMGEVELADALIRTLDLGGSQGWVYSQSADDRQLDVALEEWQGWSVGKRHFVINARITEVGEALHVKETAESISHDYSELLDTTLLVARSFGYDLEGAMIEKLAYNKQRADHKRENRAKAGGKKF